MLRYPLFIRQGSPCSRHRDIWEQASKLPSRNSMYFLDIIVLPTPSMPHSATILGPPCAGLLLGKRISSSFLNRVGSCSMKPGPRAQKWNMYWKLNLGLSMWLFRLIKRLTYRDRGRSSELLVCGSFCLIRGDGKFVLGFLTQWSKTVGFIRVLEWS